MAVGTRTSSVKARSVLTQARVHAGRMEDIVTEAQRIASSIVAGRYGQRKHGQGDNFWQFRPYGAGEAATRIDWRRSARDNHTYIRDREWAAAQTIFLWPDLSASMRYQSRAGQHSKEMRSLMLALILAEIFSRSGERIAIPGVLEPTHARNGAERLAHALAHAGPNTKMADFSQISPYANLIIASDFLSTVEELEKKLAPLVKRHIQVHLVEIADPAEAQFPFSGNIRFYDPEDGREFIAERAQSYRNDYQRLYEARRKTLATICRHHGWSFTLSMTDRPLSETLHHLNTAIRANADCRWGQTR